MIHRIRLVLLVFPVMAFLLAPAAHAAQKEELQALSGHIMASLTGWAGDRGWEAVTSGETLIENSGTYYAVTLPHLSFKDHTGRTLEVGLVALNALPGSKPGEWKVTLALPTPLIMKDIKGEQIMSVGLGSQSFSGAWSAPLSAFTAISARYGDIKIDYLPAGLKGGIPSLTLTADQGGMMELTGSNARLLFEKTGAILTVSRFGVRGGGEGAKVAKLRGILPDFLPLDAFLGGSGVTATAGGINLFLPGNQGHAERTIVAENIRAGINARNLSGTSGSMNAEGGFSGLKVAPASPNLAAIVPAQMTFKLDAANLPVDALAAGGGMDAMAQAGTALTLRNGTLSNPSYAFSADFMQTANMAAPLKTVGRGTLTVSGLDTLTNAVAAELDNPATAAELKPYLRDVLAALMAMQLTGKPGKDDSGKPVRTIALENNANGQVFLNGQDIGVLMRMMPKTGK